MVDSFKLLGVTINKKLNFRQHIRNIEKEANKRLFSIKRLFYLSFSVKVQFFKSFIMPIFDYCSTLCIYLTRSIIQTLANCYYFQIPKASEFNFMLVNNTLEKLGLQAFQHRLITRLIIFCWNVIFFN